MLKFGCNILILSDKIVDEKRVAILALLATSVIHQYLIKKGLRTSTGLIVETSSARDTHHFALLAGYDAEVIHSFLVINTLQELVKSLLSDLTITKAIDNFQQAIGKGLLKIMSKMGISTYMSYCGAQIFEAI